MKKMISAVVALFLFTVVGFCQRQIPINVAFCFDENLWMQADVTITSLLCMAEERGTASKCCYNIYCVVPPSIDQVKKNILKAEVKKYSPLSTINFLTVTNQLDNVATGMSQEAAQRKRAMCYRLLLPQMLPDVDKIIYTDVNLIFNCDLQDLDNIDISKYYVAAVKDEYDYSKEGFKNKIWKAHGLYAINDKGQYINSGVLVLNLKKIRQDGIDKKWLQLINIDSPFPDQDVINVACLGNILLLPHYYNSDGNGSRIFHFAAKGKPWETHDKKFKNRELWWYYAQKTPFSLYFLFLEKHNARKQT